MHCSAGSKCLYKLGPLDTQIQTNVSKSKPSHTSKLPTYLPTYSSHEGILQLISSYHFRIVTVDLSPEWSVKKLILTGSADGSVKQWSIVHEDGSTKIKTALVHETHTKEKEVWLQRSVLWSCKYTSVNYLMFQNDWRSEVCSLVLNFYSYQHGNILGLA